MRMTALLLIPLISCALTTVRAQVRVHPTGVNVNAHGASSVYLTFGGLGTTYAPAEGVWCGSLVPAAPAVGARCDPTSIFGRLPARYDLSRSGGGVFTDVMSIPPAVTRRAYDAAVAGANSAFYYVRRFVSSTGQPDQYVAVTCRMAGGGARVPLALTDVRLAFDVAAPVLFLAAGTVPPSSFAEITYNGTGRLVGRWEVVAPGDELPETRDLLPEASLPPGDRGSQRRYTQVERFNVFLPPTGKVTLRGPAPSRLPTLHEGSYLLLLRIEASDDKEGDSNLGSVGAGSAVVHSGAIAGFALPALRYVVGTGPSQPSPRRGLNALRLLGPPDNARLNRTTREFAWAEVPGTGTYDLHIEGQDGRVVLAAVLDASTTRYVAPSWLSDRAAGQSLRWRVAALNVNGSILQRSEWRRLSAQ